MSANLRILLVDDEPVTRNLLKLTLSREGFDAVTLAEDGVEALERMKTFNYDLVITDIVMPRMDGMELMEKVQEDYQTPVILITGDAASISGRDALEHGALDFIIKPFKNVDIRLSMRRAVTHIQKMAKAETSRTKNDSN